MSSESRQAAFGAILAGGAGRRIGGAKPTAELAGRPLIAHALEAISAAGLMPLVVAKPDTDLPDLTCEILIEPPQPSHPACGLIMALRRSDGLPLVALACDMPFLAPGLLSWLATAPEPLVLPEVEAKLQPFPGKYHASLLPRLESAVAADSSLRDCLEEAAPRRLRPAELARFGSLRRLAFNVNTKAELAAAEMMIREHG